MAKQTLSSYLDRYRSLSEKMLDEHRINKAVFNLQPRLRDEKIRQVWDRVLQKDEGDSEITHDNGIPNNNTDEGHTSNNQEGFYRGFYHGTQSVLWCLRLTASKDGPEQINFPYRK